MKVTRENFREAAKMAVRYAARTNKMPEFWGAYSEPDGVAMFYFTPIAWVEKEKKYVMFPFDVERILALLLSHPNVKDIEWSEEDGAFKFVFQVPEDVLEEEEL